MTDSQEAVQEPKPRLITDEIVMGWLVQELRNRCRYSRRKLSRLAGLGDNDNIVKPMEKGERSLKVTEIYSLSKALGMDHHQFLDLFIRRMEEHGLSVYRPISPPAPRKVKKNPEGS